MARRRVVPDLPDELPSSVEVLSGAPAAEYADCSERFVRECFNFPNESERTAGKDIYQWQSEALAAYDRGEPRIAIRSGHGVGKSTLVAWILWHRILCRFPQKAGVTAPSERQLHDALWAEFRAWGERLNPELRVLVEDRANSAFLKARPSESFISIKTARADQPEAIQGLHSEWELFVFDEASGGQDATWEAAQSCLTGPHPTAILTGNPIRRTGFFCEAHTSLKDMWWTRHVSRGEICNLDTDHYAQLIERESGGRDTSRYLVRVLGDFPLSEDDTLIPFELAEAAHQRDVTVPKNTPVIWGLSYPRYGHNRAALAKRQTKVLLEPVKAWALRDPPTIAAKVKQEWDETPDGLNGLRPVVICIDDTAVGGAVTQGLRNLGLPARSVNAAELPSFRNAAHYANLWTELWVKTKEWLSLRDCQIPAHYAKSVKGDDLVGELTTQKYEFVAGLGKMKINPPTPTEDTKDLAGAVVLTFASDAASLVHWRDNAKPWKPAINKGIV